MGWGCEIATLALAAITACGDIPGRPPDAPAPFCGDGIVTPNPDPALNESCDDGAATGGPDSLCTLDCKDATREWIPLPGDTILPFPARKLVEALPAHLVISNFDDNGIALVPISNVGETQVLKKYSAPIDFEVGRWSSQGPMEVMWIERAVPGVGGPFLLIAPIGVAAPVIRELPYPVAGGAGGRFVTFENVGAYGMVEISDGRLVRVWPERAAPGGDLTMHAFDLGPAGEGSIAFATRLDVDPQLRVAVFTQTESATAIVLAIDPNGGPTTREWDTSWLKRVIHAADGRWTTSQGPYQVALLAPDGTIDILALGSTPGEILDTSFGVVPGAQQLQASFPGSPGLQSIVTLDDQGRVVLLRNNGRGRALRPQYFPLRNGCTVCTLGETANYVDWFALDTIAIHGYVF
jgi:hypothetical protein